jgi:hypothetical protein
LPQYGITKRFDIEPIAEYAFGFGTKPDQHDLF